MAIFNQFRVKKLFQAWMNMLKLKKEDKCKSTIARYPIIGKIMLRLILECGKGFLELHLCYVFLNAVHLHGLACCHEDKFLVPHAELCFNFGSHCIMQDNNLLTDRILF